LIYHNGAQMIKHLCGQFRSLYTLSDKQNARTGTLELE